MMTEKKDDENVGSFYMGRMRPPPEPDRVLPKGALTAVAVLAFVGILWYAYPQGAEKYTDVNVPVVTADTTPYKSSPVDPGGMEVRHQDSTVFDSLNKKAAAKPEKLAPKQEQPLDKTKLGLDITKKAQLNLEPEMKQPVQDITAPAKPVVKHEDAKPVVKAETPKPVVKPAPVASGKVYVQLGSYRDLSGAKSDWAKLQKKYPQYLKGLAIKTQKVDIPGKGVFHRLQAGSVTESRAKEICSALAKLNPGGCVLAR